MVHSTSGRIQAEQLPESPEIVHQLTRVSLFEGVPPLSPDSDVVPEGTIKKLHWAEDRLLDRTDHGGAWRLTYPRQMYLRC